MSKEVILTNNLLFNEIVKAIIKKNGICHLQIYFDTLPDDKKRTMLKTFNAFLDVTQKNIQSADHKDIMKFKEYLDKQYPSNGTYNVKLNEISKIFELYKIDGIIKVDLIAHLKAIKRLKNKPVDNKIKNLPINYNDVLNVIVNPDRISVIIRFLFNTGCRITESLNIKNTDISYLSQSEKSIHIKRKGDKEADIPIENELYNEIKSIYNKDNEYLFYTESGMKYNRCNLYSQITKKFDIYLNKKYLLLQLENKTSREKREIRRNFEKKKYYVRPHLLRHLFACYKLLVEQESIKAVSNALSHSSTSITQDMYIHDDLKEWHIV